MAKKTISKYFSDISGEEIEGGGPTVGFSFDGATYEIDLTGDEKQELKQALKPYMSGGRRVSGNTRRARSSRSSSASSGGAKVIRDWAREQGMVVPARGRVPTSIIEAYNNAH